MHSAKRRPGHSPRPIISKLKPAASRSRAGLKLAISMILLASCAHQAGPATPPQAGIASGQTHHLGSTALADLRSLLSQDPQRPADLTRGAIPLGPTPVYRGPEGRVTLAYYWVRIETGELGSPTLSAPVWLSILDPFDLRILLSKAPVPDDLDSPWAAVAFLPQPESYALPSMTAEGILSAGVDDETIHRMFASLLTDPAFTNASGSAAAALQSRGQEELSLFQAAYRRQAYHPAFNAGLNESFFRTAAGIEDPASGSTVAVRNAALPAP
jgi:hypothetical protein